MKELGLYRTTKVNYVPYANDGNGRDKYIASDRGGLFSNNNSTNPENTRRTGTTLNTKISYKSVSPYFKTPNFHYHSDGYGRDSYIYTNGGGLIYDSKPLNSYKLTDFLRSNEDNGVFINKNERIWLSKNQDKYQKFLRAKEKDIIDRLYENEKKKFTKNKKVEDSRPLQTEADDIKLPKLFDKKYCTTLDNNIENEKIEDNKNGEYTANNIMVKNKTNNNLDGQNLLESLSKINNFDATKRLKRTNKSFNQAYLHLRNVNYNYS